MSCLWLGIAIIVSVPAVVTLLTSLLYLYVRLNLMDKLIRIFQEKPLFVIPRGERSAAAEDVVFSSVGGLNLRGCYLKAEQHRKGVILFGLEFGSNRWSCRPYCEPLLQAGYDIFAFEPRNQGQSQAMPGYEPLHWLTTYEVADTQAAIQYLKKRPDADPKGIGFFGISKGANAGLIAAARDRSIRCLATDGAFGTLSTMIPYMRKWVALYNQNYLAHGLLPSWFYGLMAMAGVRNVQRQRRVRFEHLEDAMPQLKRPLLMIHGGDDTYIKVDTAREPFKLATGPKTFWVVANAKHNQAINVAGQEYAEKVVGFFDMYLGGLEPATVAAEPLDDLPNLSETAAVASAS